MTGEDAGSTDRRVRAIAFDWGGVFTEGTFDGRAVTALADLLGVDEATVAASYYPLMESFEVGAFDLREFARRLQGAVAAHVDEDAFRTTFLGAARERPAMYDLLAGIPDAYRVAMLSNNVPELCDRVRSDARMARIERFVFSNEIGVRKPDPAAFAALEGALGLPASATVFIDDNPANVAACRALGFQGLLLDSVSGFARRWRSTVGELGHLVDGPAWRAEAAGGDERPEEVGDDRTPRTTRPVKLLQGYVWHPRDLEIDLADYLPARLDPEVHVLWDVMPAAPFTFFDDGTLSATQRVYQLTVMRFVRPDEDPGALLPWLAETLQAALDATPEGVGWQVMEDLRELG